jgi:hypothetical protein
MANDPKQPQEDTEKIGATDPAVQAHGGEQLHGAVTRGMVDDEIEVTHEGEADQPDPKGGQTTGAGDVMAGLAWGGDISSSDVEDGSTGGTLEGSDLVGREDNADTTVVRQGGESRRAVRRLG